MIFQICCIYFTHLIFFKKLEDRSPFHGAIGAPVLDLELVTSALSGSHCLDGSSDAHKIFLRITSGVTPVDFLVAIQVALTLLHFQAFVRVKLV